MQLDDHQLGSFLADAFDARQAGDFFAGDQAGKIAWRRAPRQHGDGRRWADILDGDEQIEQRALGGIAKAEQHDFVFGGVGEDAERRALAERRQRRQRVARANHFVSNAAAIDDDVRALAVEQDTGEARDHDAPRDAAITDDVMRAEPVEIVRPWVIATPSASEASSGIALVSPSIVATMRATCSFSARPEPTTVFFTRAGA